MNPADFPVEQTSYSHEAEASLIGAVLMLGADAYDLASTLVDGECFYDPLHRQLWAQAEKLVLAGKHVDVPTLMDQMRGFEVDWEYVHSLTCAGYYPKRGIQQHAEMVAANAQQRHLEAVADEVRELARDESLSLEQRISKAVLSLEGVIQVRNTVEAAPIERYAAGLLDRLQAMADGKLQPGRPTRIPMLDHKLSGGFRDGQLVIVAARPSVGKSSLAQQFALTHALDGIPSAFFGMEMSNEELTNRTTANLGRVPLGALKTGRLDHGDWELVTDAVERMRGLPLHLLEKHRMSLGDVNSQARKLVRRFGIKTLVVDYLQLMNEPPRSRDRERRVELEEITRGMKQLAKQMGITIVLLSQLNRSIESRTNPRPVMSDLKECGAIEEDADVILALWTHRKGECGDLKGCAILKNRDGETGDVPLHFEGAYQRWTESTESLRSNTQGVTTKRLADDF